jgi:signal transduction histidine kinase
VLYSQEFNDEIQSLKNYNINEAHNIKISSFSDIEAYYLKFQMNLILKGRVDSTSITELSLKSNKTYRDETLKFIMQGDYYLFKDKPQDSLAYNSYVASVKSALITKDTILITESCKKIFKQLFKSRHSLDGYPIYLTIFKNFLYDKNEEATYLFHYYNYLGSEKRIEKIEGLKDALKLLENTNNSFLKSKTNQMIGVQFDFFKKSPDSALVYYLKAKSLMQEKSYQFYLNELFGINANIGLIYLRNKDYGNAKKYFKYSNSINLPKYRFIEKVKINELLSDIESQNNNWKDAFMFLKKSNEYSDTLNEHSKAAKITEINTKYETEKKAKENLQLKIDIEKKDRQKRNLWIGSISFLLFGGIIAFLIQKNTIRKQKLAEQQKELEIQKLVTVLKEQELTSIDAMIEGQEKERQRIANDLHDDLGGLMASLKLHFNALKEKQSPELYTKTNALIDEAYQKVRTVAHAKNYGVIAKQGLLKAVNEMADKISALNKITINVVDHGLENRLENNLELTLFRIIQELITNVIKHAEATEVTIHLTNHEDSINIMVEDNGKGFSPKQITKTKSGMGISSIDKRIEHLDGKLTIESEFNLGTTVIIDVPIG